MRSRSPSRSTMIEWAAVANGETVLEVAVGTGLSFKHLLRQNPDGWTEGVDRTPAMLHRARRRAARAPTDRYQLRLGDARALDYPDAAFDVVLNSYMFDLLPESQFVPVLREFRRVLRPGGRVVLVNETEARHWYERGWDLLYRLHPPLMGGCRGVRVGPAMHAAGFTHVRRQYISQWTFPSEVLYGEAPRA